MQKHPCHKKKTVLLYFLFFSLLWIVSGCNSTRTYIVLEPEVVRQAQIIALSSQLAKHKVQVIQIGETLRIIIPSDYLFNWDSANLNPPYAILVLNTISKLMLLLETTSAKVSGYTDCEASARLNKALSERQAQTVIDYLWIQGVDARLFYAIGYGSKVPLSANPMALSNRRIEINFQYSPLVAGGRTWPINLPSPSASP